MSLLRPNKFDYILTVDTQLKNCLKQGITPDFVFTIENISIFYKLFQDIPKDVCKKITVIISHRTHPNTIKQLKKSGFHVITDLWKYLEYTSNVCLMGFCWAWRILKLDEITLVGMDSCEYKPVIPPGSKPFDLVYDVIINPDNTICYLDPIHQLWYEQFMDLLELAPRELRIENYSDGCLFGGAIQWCH